MNYRKRIEAVMRAKVPRRDGEKLKAWEYIASRKNKGAYELVYRVPTGFSCLDIERQGDALFAAVGAPIEFKDYAGAVLIRVLTENFPEKIEYERAFLAATAGKNILLGFDRTGEPVVHSLRVPHMMIAGQSGYGKTDFVRWILYQLIKHNTPEEVEIWIVDLKGFSFLPFKRIPHIPRIARDLPGAKKLLEDAARIMEERSRDIWESGDRSKAEHYKTLFVVIDEAYQISPGIIKDREQRKLAQGCDAAAAKIAGTGREAGVGLFYCTQRPDAEIINPLVKANIDCKVCFKTATESNSLIVLDSPGAENLPHGIPGRAIVAAGGFQEIQAPYIGGDDVWSILLEEVRSNENERRDFEARGNDSTIYDGTSSEILFDEWEPIQAGKRSPQNIGEGKINRGTPPGNRKE